MRFCPRSPWANLALALGVHFTLCRCWQLSLYSLMNHAFYLSVLHYSVFTYHRNRFFFSFRQRKISTVRSVTSPQTQEQNSLFGSPVALDTNPMTKLFPRDPSMSPFSHSKGRTTWPFNSWIPHQLLPKGSTSRQQVVARVCTLPPHLPEPPANNSQPSLRSSFSWQWKPRFVLKILCARRK